MQACRFLVLLSLFSFSFLPATPARGQDTTSGARKIVKKLTPAYPDLARRMNLGGTVKVIATVAADGDVKAVEAKGGSPILIKAAEDAVSKWKFVSGSESKETIEVHFAP